MRNNGLFGHTRNGSGQDQRTAMAARVNHTYVAKVGGKEVGRRTTYRDVTHAVVGRRKGSGQYIVKLWSGSLEAATKSLSNWRYLDDVQIVEVEKVSK